MILELDTEVKFAGRFRCLVHKEDGSLRQDTGWFDNLITNQGLDYIGGGAPNGSSAGGVPLCTHACVGTGSTAPTFTDTFLTSFSYMAPSAPTANVESASSATYVAGPPAYWSVIKSYTFSTGISGNFTEVGVGNTGTADTQPHLFSHALIVDGGGNPTTLTILATDTLTVTYELRLYHNITDTNYTVNLNAVTYSGVFRRMSLANVPNIFYQVDSSIAGTLFAAVYNGTIGTITSTPSGGLSNATSNSSTAYSPGSYFKSFSSVWNTTAGNVGGISAFTLGSASLGQFQFSSTTPTSIPKTNIYTLTFNWNISWARYP